MYGWLLESVQHFIVQECGEEIWETILREAGARNTVFSATQQYPDALMLRLASALARFLTKDPSSPATSIPGSPAPRKPSLKSKPSWRSSSVHADTRQGFKCPFTATNALTAATKKEIDAYNSAEDVSKTLSADGINERGEVDPEKVKAIKELNRRSLALKFEDNRSPVKTVESNAESKRSPGKNLESNTDTKRCPVKTVESSTDTKRSPIKTVESNTDTKSSPVKNVQSNNDIKRCPVKTVDSNTDIKMCPVNKIVDLNTDTKRSPVKTVDLNTDTKRSPVKTEQNVETKDKDKKGSNESSKDSELSEPTSPCSSNSNSNSETRRKSILKSPRKTSVTLAMDVYSRRGSVPRPRMNSLSLVSGDKLAAMREKFGTPEKVMHFFGRCFVKFFSNYGYDTMIRATGRYFCTFLQSVDNIHQRMRFTFPRMRSPSMQLTRAHIHGAELLYSSTRTGFTHYLMGQLYEIAEDIFSLKLKVSVVKESMEGSYYVAVLRLEFDNSDYVQSLMLRKSLPCLWPAVPASLLLQLFPFGVLLDRRMKILKAGDKLVEAWGGPYNRIEKQPIADILRLRKPKVSFTWDKVVCMQTMLFELELMRWAGRWAKQPDNVRRGSQGARAILLKGPIYLLEEIDSLIFLCSPIFNDLEELRQAGLYLADLNGHGLSKEMLLHGWQHLSRLELLFEKAESRCLTLEKSCRLRDQWKKRGDQLLYSMIPRAIADHLRTGKDMTDFQDHFEGVTIIFCGMQLAEAGTRADVMQTVAYMNDVYSKIDRLLDSHRVYKVETVGTVYMLVSGAPERRRTHAAAAASAALAVASALPVLTIGVHTGPCVAAVLGKKLPRYCLVGDTVNTASRMQTSSEPGKIQISSQTAAELPPGKFRLRQRGLIKVKGKGMMETFWLEGEVEEDDQEDALQLFSALCGEN